jgi:AcrR family transcriptional regulator
MPLPGKKRRYHHGDLPTALIDTAIELINEKGVASFSLAEASRRLGVTVAAPYRHFADRDELLAAVAVRASHELAAAIRAETGTRDQPGEQLAGLARGYVRFAAGKRALFQVLFAAGLDKHKHNELSAAVAGVADAVFTPAVALCGGDRAAGEDLAATVGALAHGFAMFLLDGRFGSGDNVVDSVAERASHAVHDLIRGRLA